MCDAEKKDLEDLEDCHYSTCENEYCRREYTFNPDVVGNAFVCGRCRHSDDEPVDRFEID